MQYIVKMEKQEYCLFFDFAEKQNMEIVFSNQKEKRESYSLNCIKNVMEDSEVKTMTI